MKKIIIDQKFSIIGGGRIGQSIYKILNKKYPQKVFIWDRDETRTSPSLSISDVISGARIVFICVPSWSLREVLNNIKSFVSLNQIIVIFSKGIEVNTLKTVPEIFKEILPENYLCVFGGPFMAEEIDHGFLGMGVIGTLQKETYQEINDVFNDTKIFLHHYSDVRGVAFAGVLKNIYALGLGIADGLALGTNAKGWLAGKMIREMISMGNYFNIAQDIVYLSAISDFLASGFSPYSRNRKTGEEILKWNTDSLKSESIVSYPSIAILLKKEIKSFPIFEDLFKIVCERTNAEVVFNKLLGKNI